MHIFTNLFLVPRCLSNFLHTLVLPHTELNTFPIFISTVSRWLHPSFSDISSEEEELSLS